MSTRQEIQSKAREFLDTPFADQGREKRNGIDCVGLVLLVAEELGISSKDTTALLGSQYKHYRSTRIDGYVLAECKKRLVEKPIAKLQAGDVAVFRLPDVPCHAAVIAERSGVLYMIHAYNGGPKRVVENILDVKWRKRICGVFSFPGTVD